MANLPKDYILPLGAQIVEKMTEEEMQVILDGLAEDMPDEDELEFRELGLDPVSGERLQTSDTMFDGSGWDPNRPTRSSGPRMTTNNGCP